MPSRRKPIVPSCSLSGHSRELYRGTQGRALPGYAGTLGQRKHLANDGPHDLRAPPTKYARASGSMSRRRGVRALHADARSTPGAALNDAMARHRIEPETARRAQAGPLTRATLSPMRP